MRGPLPLLNHYWMSQATLFIHGSEVVQYDAALTALLAGGHLSGRPQIIGMDYRGIAEKRTMMGRYCLDWEYTKFMMLDDDINFLCRVNEYVASQRTMSDWGEVSDMLHTVEENLDTYPQVALGLREVNRTKLVGPPPLLEECGKCIRAVAFDTKLFCSLETQRVETMSDYDTTLQVLRGGHKNAVLWWWMSGQRSTQAPGGCSIWRTNELHSQSIDKMLQMHSGLVRARNKATISGGEFGVRRELTIQWKRAYRDGCRHRADGSGVDDPGIHQAPETA